MSWSAVANGTTKARELTLLAPVVKNRKGFHTDVAEWAARTDMVKFGQMEKIFQTSERLRLDRFREHDVEIVTGNMLPGGKAWRGGRASREPADERDNPEQGSRGRSPATLARS